MDMASRQPRPLSDPKGSEGARVPPVSETLRRKTLVKLRDAIFSGHFKPDHRLVERDLCAQTGVSRSSVREALRYLEAEGLVESRGAKGMFVVRPTIREAMEIHELRLALESAAALHFAARAADADMRALVESFEAVKNIALDDSEERWRLADRLFDLLMRGAGNKVAADLMGTLRARIRCLRADASRSAAGLREPSIQVLGELTAALARRDGAAAVEILRSVIALSATVAVERLRTRDLQRDGAEAGA